MPDNKIHIHVHHKDRWNSYVGTDSRDNVVGSVAVGGAFSGSNTFIHFDSLLEIRTLRSELAELEEKWLNAEGLDHVL